MNDIYLVIDIGGTKIAASLFNLKGKLLYVAKMKTASSKSPQKAIRRIHEETMAFLKTGKLKGSRIKKICVGCPGPFDYKTGRIIDLPNLHSWKGFNIKNELKKQFKVPVVLENDANLAALGEATYGAGRGLTDVLYITFSTGIGGGFVHRGRIYHGASGDAFEVGHMTLKKDGRRCGCKKYGCLEALASGGNLAKEAKALALKNRSSKLYKLYKKHGKMDAKTVIEAVLAKDRSATKIWDEGLEYLGIGIASLIQVVNPDTVVIGGGISNSWKLIEKPLKKHLRIYTWQRPLSACKIKKARLGDTAAVWGGLALLRSGHQAV